VVQGFGHGAPDPQLRLVIIARERVFNSRSTQQICHFCESGQNRGLRSECHTAIP
jgi:hypothetical protein